jgi:toxin ParE1/3/4
VKVRLSARARTDLRESIRFIAQDSPHNARLVRDRLDKAIQQLRLHPESGRAGRIDGTRELIIPHTGYIAGYRVSLGVLEIAALIHESRQWPADI